MKSAYKLACDRPKKPPKGWKRNKGKCRMRMIQFRVRLHGQGYLLFFCTRKSHWHGEPHPVIRSIREDDILVVPEVLYAEMTNGNS